MKAVGIIVEYNPFHNGHYHHLIQSKKTANADVVIAVMSGHFLQRGEPAIVSKWARTKMALQSGVDLVFELPFAFSSQNADVFANGAVSILDALGCHSLCFGSEEGEIEAFLKTYEWLEKRYDEFQKQLKTAISEGNSYPKAMSIAFQHVADGQNHLLNLTQPNNILGFQYVKAIFQQNSSMKPLTIPRIGAGYHDQTYRHAHIASATSVRKELFNDFRSQNVKNYLPESSYDILMTYHQEYSTFHDWETYFPFLKYAVLSKSRQELNDIYEMEEGLENRIVEQMKKASSFQEFLRRLKTKRYTWTRLQRLCVYLLTNTKKKEMEHVLKTKKASYLRLLGMSKKGRQYLQAIKKDLPLPLVAKISSFPESMLAMDLKATSIYALALKEPLATHFIKQEYANPPLRSGLS